jgi:peptidyl-tRNA hydrolase, PTH1 family
MKLIIGIGNPGKKYESTRHNAGFMAIDELVRQMVDDKWLVVKKFNSLIINHQSSIIFSKPQTFMNESGNAVVKILTHFKIKTPDLWVIHDDLDLKLGTYKLQFGKGPKVHGGILSIEERLGTGNFWRVRIGVENRDFETRISGEDYVLQKFESGELEIIGSTLKMAVGELLNKLQKN